MMPPFDNCEIYTATVLLKFPSRLVPWETTRSWLGPIPEAVPAHIEHRAACQFRMALDITRQVIEDTPEPKLRDYLITQAVVLANIDLEISQEFQTELGWIDKRTPHWLHLPWQF